ncbi:Neuropeptide Y receptor type 2 [Trichoplax sp. H2]|nr:Neuropeptide Y receptor type 2 [Trichoplax sp. H2]|eukprot:RDD38420.1 Neuropeptide Y receptor type 2 [Trichoplax sp. H2]
MATNLAFNGSLNQTVIDYNLLTIYAYAVAVPISFIGILANFFLLYLISSGNHFNHITYKLIRIAVISDLTSLHFSLIVLTTLLLIETVDYQIANILCQNTVVITFCCYGISMTTLCMISVDRYFTVVRPFSLLYRKHKKRIIYLGQAIGCLISLSVSIPCALFLGVYPDEIRVCDFPNVNLPVSIYFHFLTLFLFIIPLSIIIINYSRVILCRVNYIRPGQQTDGHSDDRMRRNKFTRVLVTITSIYILSTWPFFANLIGMSVTLSSAREIRKLGTGIYLMSLASFFSTFAVNVISPFIYFKFDHNINKKFFSTIRLIFK